MTDPYKRPRTTNNSLNRVSTHSVLMYGGNIIMLKEVNRYINGNKHSKYESIRNHDEKSRKVKLNLLKMIVEKKKNISYNSLFE